MASISSNSLVEHRRKQSPLPIMLLCLILCICVCTVHSHFSPCDSLPLFPWSGQSLRFWSWDMLVNASILDCPGIMWWHFPTLPSNLKLSEHCRIHSKFLHKNRICSLCSLNIAKSSFYYRVIIIVALYGLQSPGFGKTVHSILTKWGYLEFSLISNIYHLFEMIIFKIPFYLF